MEIILIILIFIVIGVLAFNQNNTQTKNPTKKKEEIIEQYEQDLETLLSKYGNNKAKQIEEKKKFLRNCNSELSRNIFFTQEEAIKVIERLLKK